MYEAFYGLKTQPFKLNPDPSFYFGSSQHARARAYLEYGVSRNEGFIVITGEIGAGKTTVLRSLLEGLDRDRIVVGHLVTTQLDHDDVLRMVGASFGLPVKEVPKAKLLMDIEAFLLSQMTQGRRCLLVVDEAQNLTPRAVEELRMLSNFQYGNQALLQSFLVGQPEFRDILRRPDMEQFRQRVSASCHIGPLDANETRSYIEHRLKAAGSTGKPTFDNLSFALLHAATGGVPRRINAFCDRLLLLGFLSEKTHFTSLDVQEVRKEFEAEMGPAAAPVMATAPNQADARAAAPAHEGSAWRAIDSLPRLEEVIQPGRRPAPGSAHAGLRRVVSASALLSQDERLARLEESMIRLERINLQTLVLMERLLELAEAPEKIDHGAPEDSIESHRDDGTLPTVTDNSPSIVSGAAIQSDTPIA